MGSLSCDCCHACLRWSIPSWINRNSSKARRLVALAASILIRGMYLLDRRWKVYHLGVALDQFGQVIGHLVGEAVHRSCMMRRTFACTAFGRAIDGHDAPRVQQLRVVRFPLGRAELKAAVELHRLAGYDNRLAPAQRLEQYSWLNHETEIVPLSSASVAVIRGRPLRVMRASTSQMVATTVWFTSGSVRLSA